MAVGNILQVRYVYRLVKDRREVWSIHASVAVCTSEITAFSWLQVCIIGSFEHASTQAVLFPVPGMCIKELLPLRTFQINLPIRRYHDWYIWWMMLAWPNPGYQTIAHLKKCNGCLETLHVFEFFCSPSCLECISAVLSEATGSAGRRSSKAFAWTMRWRYENLWSIHTCEYRDIFFGMFTTMFCVFWQRVVQANSLQLGDAVRIFCADWIHSFLLKGISCINNLSCVLKNPHNQWIHFHQHHHRGWFALHDVLFSKLTCQLTYPMVNQNC